MSDRVTLAKVRQLAEGNHGPDVKSLADEVLFLRELVATLTEQLDRIISE